MRPPKRLVVNADDFGFTQDVNEGIVEAHREGIVTATTLMANGSAFEDAVRLARENRSLDVGCHLVLIGGASLLPPYRPLPSTAPELVRAVAMRQIPVYEELAAQVRKILAAGIAPTHLDTHKHTALLPPVLGAVARLSEEFGIRWVRRPFRIPILQAAYRRILKRNGCRTTDHFTGYRLTGRFGTQELVDLIRRLPEGATEFMCHPGKCSSELQNSRTKLKESRQRELEALTNPAAREALRANSVRLANYREL